MKKIFTLLFLLVIVAGCQNTTVEDPPEGYTLEDYTKVASHFDPIPVPDYNELTLEKVKLGRYLFYEKRLSADSSIACESCHYQRFAFADSGPETSTGANGEAEFRNTMGLFNTAYYPILFWDGHGDKIESPAYRGLWLPMIFASDTNEVFERLKNDPMYPPMFEAAFGPDYKINGPEIAHAIASFVRTIVSDRSPYDKFVQGQTTAMTPQQVQGMNLFFSDTVNCAECHSGELFTDNQFHNTGTTTHYFDFGYYYVTGDPNDRGKFKTPTLRNVEITYPYLSTGVYHTLEEVIDNYNRGGYPYYNKSELIVPLNLNARQKADLLAFLIALTDEELITDEKYSNPFE